VCGGVIQTIAIAGIIITTRQEDKLRWYYHGRRGLGRRELRRKGASISAAKLSQAKLAAP